MVNIRDSYGLRTHPCGGAPHPDYVVFHTQIAPLGWGTTSVVLSMPDDMPPLGWGIILVDGGQSRQRDKQYAPMCGFARGHGHGHGQCPCRWPWPWSQDLLVSSFFLMRFFFRRFVYEMKNPKKNQHISKHFEIFRNILIFFRNISKYGGTFQNISIYFEIFRNMYN